MVVSSPQAMAREFQPVRFFVTMGVAAFVVCGATVFCTHRAPHGRTAEERAAYAIGEEAGEEAPQDAKLPSDAELNIMAEVFQVAGLRRTTGLGPGFRKRVRQRIQENAFPTVNRNSWVILRTILWIGLVAGTLDITENLVFSQLRGVTPWRVFQYIASGLIGTSFFTISA